MKYRKWTIFSDPRTGGGVRGPELTPFEEVQVVEIPYWAKRAELTRGEAWALLTDDSTHRDHESARARLRELAGLCPYCDGRGWNDYSVVAGGDPLGEGNDHLPCGECGGTGRAKP